MKRITAKINHLMMARAAAWLLAAALALTLTPVAASAASVDSSRSYLFELSEQARTPEGPLAPGSVLTLTVKLHREDSAAGYALYTAADEIRYDSNFFELVPAADGETVNFSGTNYAGSFIGTIWAGSTDNYRLLLLGYNGSMYGVQAAAEEPFGTFRLRVKAGATGTSRLSNTHMTVARQDGLLSYFVQGSGLGYTIGASEPEILPDPPNGTDPGTTDPGTTDPGTTDPGTTDPGTTDPGTTDPGTTDPGTTDPGTTDPGTTTPDSPAVISDGIGIVRPSTISIIDGSTPLAGSDFLDVPNGHWAYEYVTYLAGYGFVTGKSTTLFAPNDPITRAEFVTILHRMEGGPKTSAGSAFADVSANAYYAEAVVWGEQSGIVYGTSATTFSPNDRVTREQIAALLSRYAEYKAFAFVKVNELSAFTDSAQIQAYAKETVEQMQQADIIGGYEDGSFRPRGDATRAEAAKMLALVHYLMRTGLSAADADEAISATDADAAAAAAE
ncbi:MAG: S-layer homology domain-containing protein [Clostridiales Family XIII bacterium]|nr:S-layer homology domain-containing protein [Clostridiales Family XIII bacterium]